jgi:nicotinamide mononucleotide transporter
MDTLRFLDILGFVVGLVYLILEYKASIWLWLASIIMPAIDMVLYYKAGLYADFGMAIYQKICPCIPRRIVVPCIRIRSEAQE